jgi:hypothetical protein
VSRPLSQQLHHNQLEIPADALFRNTDSVVAKDIVGVRSVQAEAHVRRRISGIANAFKLKSSWRCVDFVADTKNIL